ncbi:MAG: hypothetical protein CH6_1243 [Candidatus Kapaibacterium sp.]|nr:MAG: hypothetical protein CH6_1243 [Candidatus Kapabacteria bacterium]
MNLDRGITKQCQWFSLKFQSLKKIKINSKIFNGVFWFKIE